TALTQNTAKASLKGFEVEMTALPVNGLELSGSIGYIDPQYKRYTDPVSGADLSMLPFTYISKLTWNAAGTYKVPVSIGQLSAHADYGFVSRKYFAANAGREELDSQAGYGVRNARIAAELVNPGVELAVWAKNLAGKTYDTYRLS